MSSDQRNILMEANSESFACSLTVMNYFYNNVMYHSHFLKSCFLPFPYRPSGYPVIYRSLEMLYSMFHLLRLNSGGASSRCFVYLFPNYMYEISEFMRSQVKWKVTVERSSEKLEFAKPKKWQDSTKWKVESQVTDSEQMSSMLLSTSSFLPPFLVREEKLGKLYRAQTELSLRTFCLILTKPWRFLYKSLSLLSFRLDNSIFIVVTSLPFYLQDDKFIHLQWIILIMMMTFAFLSL